MSKLKHTPEPWSDAPLAKPNIIINEADWTRAVKCVNACAGLTNEQLAELPSIIEEGTIAIAENEKLKAERNELLSALIYLVNCNTVKSMNCDIPDALKKARAVIDEARGGAL